MNPDPIKIQIQNLTMAYGPHVVMHDITAAVKRGSVFVIMGNSGCGKSTLLRHMIGLQRPAQGDVLYDGKSFWGMDNGSRQIQLRKYGVLFQSGALWSSICGKRLCAMSSSCTFSLSLISVITKFPAVKPFCAGTIPNVA